MFRTPVKLYWFILKCSYSATIKNFVMYIYCMLRSFRKPYQSVLHPTKFRYKYDCYQYNLSLSVCLVLTKLAIKVYSWTMCVSACLGSKYIPEYNYHAIYNEVCQYIFHISNIVLINNDNIPHSFKNNNWLYVCLYVFASFFQKDLSKYFPKYSYNAVYEVCECQCMFKHKQY